MNFKTNSSIIVMQMCKTHFTLMKYCSIYLFELLHFKLFIHNSSSFKKVFYAQYGHSQRYHRLNSKGYNII